MKREKKLNPVDNFCLFKILYHIKDKNIDISIDYFDENVSNIVGEVVVKLGGKEYFKTNIIQKEEKLKEEKIWFIRLIDKIFGR